MFEYKTVNVDTAKHNEGDADTIARVANELASDGWRLIVIYKNVLVFERSKAAAESSNKISSYGAFY